MDSPLRTVFPFFAPALVALAGCAGPAAMDPAEVAELRTRLVLDEEPDDAETVLDVRTALVGGERPDVHAMLGHDHDHEHEGEAAEPGKDSADDHADEAAHDADHAEPEDEHSEAAHAHVHEHGHVHANGEHGEHDHGATAEARDVVVVGIVGGVPNPSAQTFAEFPFAKGKALFFLADPEAVAVLEEEGHRHAPGEECSFCLANAANASSLIAAVQVTDDNGRVLPIDARDLFDVKEGDAVVVRGSAKVAPGGILTVNVAGLYVRR